MLNQSVNTCGKPVCNTVENLCVSRRFPGFITTKTPQPKRRFRAGLSKLWKTNAFTHRAAPRLAQPNHLEKLPLLSGMVAFSTLSTRLINITIKYNRRQNGI